MSEMRCVSCGQPFDVEAEDADRWEPYGVSGYLQVICPGCLTGSEESADDFLPFLGALRDLVRSEDLTANDRLEALDHALTLVLSGLLPEARTWVQKIVSSGPDSPDG